MENTALRRTSNFKEENLTRNDYTVSLLNEGLRSSLLSSDEVATFQHQLMLLMRKSIERYTRGQSSSVRTAVAQNILISNVFTIDVYLLSLSVEDALAALCTDNVQMLWDKGQDCIVASIEQSKELFSKVQQTRLNVELIAYNDTIDHAFDDFFENYEYVFGAHDAAGSIDYPLALDDQSLRGILYMKQYLQKLLLENEFCAHFSAKELTALLQNYGRQYHTDYRELLVNIFELTMYNSIFSVLLGNRSAKLAISAYECTLLQERLSRIDPSQVPLLIDEALERLCTDLNIVDTVKISYIHRCKASFISRLLKALEQGTLQNFVITDNLASPKETLSFKEGKKLDDKSFRVVFNRVLRAEGAQEKAEIIHNQLRSFTDFVDILRSGSLHGAEYSVLYHLLDDLELSLLTKKTFFETYSNPADDFSLPDQLNQIGKSGIDYLDALAEFLRNLENNRRIAIEKMIQLAISSDETKG